MVGTVRGGGQNLSRPQHKTIINYRIIGGSIEAKPLWRRNCTCAKRRRMGGNRLRVGEHTCLSTDEKRPFSSRLIAGKQYLMREIMHDLDSYSDSTWAYYEFRGRFQVTAPVRQLRRK